jgi:hypothetical protein
VVIDVQIVLINKEKEIQVEEDQTLMGRLIALDQRQSRSLLLFESLSLSILSREVQHSFVVYRKWNESELMRSVVWFEADLANSFKNKHNTVVNFNLCVLPTNQGQYHEDIKGCFNSTSELTIILVCILHKGSQSIRKASNVQYNIKKDTL